MCAYISISATVACFRSHKEKLNTLHKPGSLADVQHPGTLECKHQLCILYRTEKSIPATVGCFSRWEWWELERGRCGEIEGERECERERENGGREEDEEGGREKEIKRKKEGERERGLGRGGMERGEGGEMDEERREREPML